MSTGVRAPASAPLALDPAVGLAVVVAAAGIALWQHRGTTASPDPPDTDPSPDVDPSPDAAATPDAGFSPDADRAPDAGAVDGSTAEPLDDRDRVRELLAAHGGRVRQSRIVEETGWSKSKVSQLLSEMAEDGSVTKLRVGRQNLVSLPGHEPDAAGSPEE